jgi:hypothetical protein
MRETRLGRFWRAIKLIYLFLLPTRFSLLAVVIVGWAFLMSDQGADILRALVEYDLRKDIHPHYWRMFAFVIATSAFSCQAWYWARQSLRVKPPSRIEEDDYFAYQPPPELFPRIALWVPRLLGAFGFLIPIIAFLQIGSSYSASDTQAASTDAPTGAVHWMLFWLVLSLVIFIIFVILRRFFLRRRDSTLLQREPRAFDRSTQIVLAVTVIAAVVFFVCVTYNPVGISPLGSASVVFLTAALWVPIGTVLVLFGMRLRFPILSALLVWALLWSPLSDRNHVIRTVDKSGAGPVDLRPDVAGQLADWYARVAPRHAGDEVPIFIVATEGGGIRAAYWTASALTAVQDRYPEFADHLFAISGVSGGSLGAAVFDAVLAHGPAPADPNEKILPGDDAAKRAEERKTLRYAAKRVLSFDALTPALASLAQADLAQRFLPVGFPDREKALEEAWERGWSSTMANDPLFSKGILSTLQANRRLPSLFLNGTMVETGDRIITSNCRIHPRDKKAPPSAVGDLRDSGDLLPEFRNAFDSFADLRRDIPFSAAAGMSARFTYVSPAGRIPDQGSHGTIAGHVVDGGYFENSGAVTAAEIVGLIRRIKARTGWKLHPYVVIIDSEDVSKLCQEKPAQCVPDPAEKPFDAIPDEAGPRHGKPETWINEVMSPLRALLHTRDARGSQAVGDIRQMLATEVGKPSDLVELRLIQRKVPLPLGWLLSERSRIEIDLATQREGGNLWAMKRIGDALHASVAHLPADPVARSAQASVDELKKEKNP